MKTATTSTAALRRKVVHEFGEMAALALYLYICLGAVLLLKAAILRDVGIDIAIWGIAAVNTKSPWRRLTEGFPDAALI